MTTAAPHDVTHSASDERIRRAWASYRENLVDLDGVAYVESERAEWEYLQAELREIATERILKSTLS
jgi:hypothetical protein